MKSVWNGHQYLFKFPTFWYWKNRMLKNKISFPLFWNWGLLCVSSYSLHDSENQERKILDFLPRSWIFLQNPSTSWISWKDLGKSYFLQEILNCWARILPRVLSRNPGGTTYSILISIYHFVVLVVLNGITSTKINKILSFHPWSPINVLESLDKNHGISWISWHDFVRSCKFVDFLVRNIQDSFQEFQEFLHWE